MWRGRGVKRGLHDAPSLLHEILARGGDDDAGGSAEV